MEPSTLKRSGLFWLAYLAAGAWGVATTEGYSLTISHGSSVQHSDILIGRGGEISLSPANRNTKIQSRGEYTTEDGGHVEWENISKDAVRVLHKHADVVPVGATFSFPPNDFFYGVWEYPWNGSITNNNHSYADIGIYGEQPGINWANARAPFFFSKSGFGIYVDTDRIGSFDFTQSGQARFVFNASSLTYMVLYNTNLTALLMQYANMSSKIQMPPESGYGPIFWSDDFERDFHAGVTNAQENYYDVIDHLQSNQIRATGMFADRPYGTGNSSFGNFDFDPKFYPNAEAFIANLSTYGYDMQVWVANRAFLDTQLYNISVDNGWLFPGINATQFLGPALNLSIPGAYDYFLQKLQYFARLGVKGFKIDRGEEHEMPDSEQNIQMSLFQDLCYKAMSAVWGDGNFFTFSRSAFDRSRSKTAIWNGDSTADFTGLQYSVASGIRAGLIGFPMWGSDTGGYLRSNSTPTEEVWARWMHFSALSPMYEIMVGTNHTPWYGDYTPRLVGVLKKTADLHTRLLPYIRSYTYAAAQTGLPIMRALFLEFPSDAAVYETADAYMFGKELLVAPIVTAGSGRSVYFPATNAAGAGGRFLEYFNKTEVHLSGSTANVSALPLEYSPVYVREGAILVTGDVYQGNARWVAGWKPRITVELYPSYNVSTSSFVYYRGKEGNAPPGPMTLTMTTDAQNKSITISYEDLGLEGAINVYHKSAVSNATLIQTIPLPAGGRAQTLKIDGLVSLFD